MEKQKTLLNFFNKIASPKSPSHGNHSKQVLSNNSTPKATTPKPLNGKVVSSLSASKNSKLSRKRNVSENKEANCENNNNDDEDINEKPKEEPKNVKRRRIVIASDSEGSEDEYKPPTNDHDSSAEESETDTPKKQGKTSIVTTPSFNGFTKLKTTPKNSLNGKKETPASKQNSSKDSSDATEDGSKEWLHEKLSWLKPENIRDKNKRIQLDPDYNPNTLFVPEDFKKSLTPAMKQWWDLKSEHFDTVLFFKVGKFYELYHMDATIGVKELGLIYMKGAFAHSGFPEITFDKFSDCLVDKGYKVARVEQTETPAMMEERCRNKSPRVTKFDKVVTREVCQVISKGTKIGSPHGQGMGDGNSYLYAISEKPVCDKNLSEYGVCFIDTSMGEFNLGQFQDDRFGSRLLTLFALYPPVEVVYDKKSVSKRTMQFVNNSLVGDAKTALIPQRVFWTPSKILEKIESQRHETKYHPTISSMLDKNDHLLQTPLQEYELAMKSLGGCLWYLQECCIEDRIINMQLFKEYIPVDKVKTPEKTIEHAKSFDKHMVLDAMTLQNLKIIPLMSGDSSEETLLGTMDYCSTSFGKRLFRNWLCSPLCNPERISKRLDAVDNLLQMPELVEEVVDRLKKLPDLEKLVSKICSTPANAPKDHPDSRAIFYESDVYNKRKVKDFIATINGMNELAKIALEFKEYNDKINSSLLLDCMVQGDVTLTPSILSFKYYMTSFDPDISKEKGYLMPMHNVNKEFDEAKAGVERAKKDFDLFLDKQKKALSSKVSFVTSDKNRYMLEVPEHVKVPSGFECHGGRKGFKRYYSKEIKEMLSVLISAEELHSSAIKEFNNYILAHFTKDIDHWKRSILCTATVDVLISLTLYLKSSEVAMCRPQFSLPKDCDEPYLKIVDGQHPTFVKYYTKEDYIPNSVYIGKKKVENEENLNDGGKLVLVTGPNMGGKSTFMRQTGVLVVMAQLGSYVPATLMELTPVDRIFTRVGASDNLSKGESTFFVEASDTASILHYATSNSLALIDEFGRGTATNDGTALASGVLQFLAAKVRCRALFSTHYHSLVEDFLHHPNVGLGHMACMVEKDNESPEIEKITFLYKFVNGACPKSYGFNVASLAGIPKEIVQQGHYKARQLECSTKISRVLRELLCFEDPKRLMEELAKRLKIS